MEHHYYQIILTYLQAHPHLANFFIYLIAFSESLPLIGTIVPGSVTMTVVGVLIGTGALPMASSLLIASIGAFTGDSVGFLVGYYYNERLRTMWPFRKHPNWLAMSENFFNKHGGKSILFGRFVGPARSTVPLVAGLLKFPWVRFCIAAIPSAAMWAVLYMVPGILLGALSREIPKAETTKFILGGLGVLLILWLIYWLIQHFFIQLTRMINFATDKLWGYLSRKKTGRFLIRWMANQQNPSDHHQLTLFLTALLSAILFLVLLVNVMHQGTLIQLNYPIFHLLQSIRIKSFNKIFVVITLLGAPKTTLIIGVFISILLFLKKQYRAATHFVIASLLTAGCVVAIKHISHSLRPQGFEQVASSSSFPSGHTAMSFVVFSFIAFLLAQIAPRNFKWISYTLSSLLIACVAFSRLYLGAHWFTDVIGSALLGLTILLICIISYRRMPHSSGVFQLSSHSAAIVFCIGVGIPWCVITPSQYPKILNSTTQIMVYRQVSLNEWWLSPTHVTPLYRNNRLGKPFQPFNVQWQGSLARITALLEKHGWHHVSNHAKLKTTLQRFASYDAQYHIPLIPWLYRDKPPVIFMIKHIQKRRRIIELRLWESGIYLQPGDKLLWLGAANIRIPPTDLLSLKKRSKISLKDSGGLNDLYKDLNGFARKYVRVSANPELKRMQTLHWDKKILLVRER